MMMMIICVIYQLNEHASVHVAYLGCTDRQPASWLDTHHPSPLSHECTLRSPSACSCHHSTRSNHPNAARMLFSWFNQGPNKVSINYASPDATDFISQQFDVSRISSQRAQAQQPTHPSLLIQYSQVTYGSSSLVFVEDVITASGSCACSSELKHSKRILNTVVFSAIPPHSSLQPHPKNMDTIKATVSGFDWSKVHAQSLTNSIHINA